ncbi:MAG: hypothetical protein GY948_16050 [Alphaproteobacteria bacterium]|nr:hypothetical protein [Alphaproteobacteria bacterium]
MRSVLLIVLCAGLGGCVHGGRGFGDLAVGAACPPVKAYSKRSQRAVRAELKSCGPECKGLAGWIKDYYVLRQQVRACQKPM